MTHENEDGIIQPKMVTVGQLITMGFAFALLGLALNGFTLSHMMLPSDGQPEEPGGFSSSDYQVLPTASDSQVTASDSQVPAASDSQVPAGPATRGLQAGQRRSQISEEFQHLEDLDRRGSVSIDDEECIVCMDAQVKATLVHSNGTAHQW
jgi:hypothetical protein